MKHQRPKSSPIAAELVTSEETTADAFGQHAAIRDSQTTPSNGPLSRIALETATAKMHKDTNYKFTGTADVDFIRSMFS